MILRAEVKMGAIVSVPPRNPMFHTFDSGANTVVALRQKGKKIRRLMLVKERSFIAPIRQSHRRDETTGSQLE